MKFLKVLTASTLGALLAFGVIAFFGFLLLIALAAAGDSQPPVRPGSVLVMDLSGAIPEQVSGDPLTQMLLDEPAYDVHDLQRALEEAATDDKIDALWIRPFNMTESWATLEAIRRSIDTFKESGKPVIASGRNFYTGEAEYYLASAADSIYMDPEAIFEFNGFAMTSMFYKGLFDKLGIEPIIIRAGDYKGAVEPYTRESLSPENREQLQAYIDDVESLFVNAIADARNMSADKVESMMDNDVLFSAVDAAEHGLVDGLLFNDQVRGRIGASIGLDPDEDLTTVTLSAYSAQIRGSVSSNRIAVVHVTGAMMAGSSDAGGLAPSGAMAGSDTIIRSIRTARERRGVQAMIVRIDSPGGLAPAADAMLREIEITSESMPVIISMGDVAASGGYWIATGGEHIVAESTTLTGSIGVFSMFFDLSAPLEDRVGLAFDTVESGPSADMFSGYRDWTRAERASLERFTDITYQAFLEKVAAARGMSTEEVDKIARGRVWTGTDAVDVGLVDELGGLAVAVERAVEAAKLDSTDYQLVSYPATPSFFQQLGMTSAVMSRTLATWMGLADRPDAQIDMLRSELSRHGQVQARMPFDITVR
ncbi:MAG: signal peptide peptidase SppA [Rhodothermales bacterium]